MQRVTLLLMAVLVMHGVRHAQAHELRPGYLEVRQTGPETFAVLWKVPARDNLRLGLYLSFPTTAHQRPSRFASRRQTPIPSAPPWPVRAAWRGSVLPSTASRQRSLMCSCGWCGRTGRSRASG
jgi:hypothetical protein